MESMTLLTKKFPLLLYVLLLNQSINLAGYELDQHIAARLTGSLIGAAVIWFMRNEMTTSRRIASLLLGLAGGIGFSTVFEWLFAAYVPMLGLGPFSCSLVASLGCVGLLEAWARDPFRVAYKFRAFLAVKKSDTKDEGENTNE